MDESYISMIRASLESPGLHNDLEFTDNPPSQQANDDHKIISKKSRKRLKQLNKPSAPTTKEIDYLSFEQHEIFAKTMPMSLTDATVKVKKRKKKQTELVVAESNKTKRNKRVQKSRNVNVKEHVTTNADSDSSENEVIDFQQLTSKYTTEEHQYEVPSDLYFKQIIMQHKNDSDSEDDNTTKVKIKTKVKLPKANNNIQFNDSDENITNIKHNKSIKKTKLKFHKISQDLHDSEDEITPPIKTSPKSEQTRLEDAFVVEEISTKFDTIDIAEPFLEDSDNAAKNVVVLEENQTQELVYNEKCFVSLRDCHTNTKFIALKSDSLIHFYGAVTLKVVYGELEVFGAILNNSSGAVKLYSPRGTALLYLKNIFNKRHDSSVIKNEFGVSNLEFDLNTATIFTYEPIKTSLVSFVNNYSPHILYPTSGIQFSPKGYYNRLTVDENWTDFVEMMAMNTKLMIVGGKGVGKSTVVRYTINKLLNKHGNVRVIDLDPGQPEFTVPGCVSVVTIKEQIFGPNYTHLQKTEISILSNINVANDVQTYIKSVQKLLDFYSTLEQLPTVINYVGFTQDIGYAIFATCCAISCPQYIVQIQSQSANKNFRQSITVENVKSDMLHFVNDLDVPTLDFKVIALDSVAENKDAWTANPKQARELSILAYFSQMAADIEYINSSHLKMHCIDLSDIEIKDLEGHTVSPLGANANLVALCSQFQGGIYRCYGYGIIRGIDIGSNTLVLLTPEDIDTLQNVYSLVINSVTLPPAFLMEAGSITDVLPYVNSDELTTFGQFVKRSYLPVNKMN